MLSRLPWNLPTIAMVIVLLAIGAPAWAQSCAITPTLPAPQSVPVTNLPAARPPPSANLPAAQAAPGGNLNLVNGLVSYWKLDDASGTTAADSMGSNPGTWVSAPGSQWTTGIINGGGNFSAHNAITGFTYSISPVGSRTISAWINTSSTAREGIVGTRDFNNNTNGWVFTANKTGAGSLGYFQNGGDLEATAVLTVGTWTHVVVTFDNSAKVCVLYVNGKAITSQSGFQTEAASAATGTIGGEYGNSTINQMFTGAIDEVGIWNRALSASEVATLYHGGNGDPFGNSSCGFSY